LKDLRLVESNAAYLVMVVVGILDTWLLYRFFAVQLPRMAKESGIRNRESGLVSLKESGLRPQA